MKTLLILVIILSACRNPQPIAADPEITRGQDLVKTAKQVNAVPAENDVTSTEKKEEVATPVKKQAKAKKARPQAASLSTPNAAGKNQQKIDSIVNDGPGGGSDIEGYIPFIKQFWK